MVPVRILVVDAANVVGSVPDGWWRDRPGAAARLHGRLVRAALPFDSVVFVVEGAARRGVSVGVEGGVTTVHAPGVGDEEIVSRCQELVDGGATVALASADRGLLARVEPLGVLAMGPRSLRDLLEAAG